MFRSKDAPRYITGRKHKAYFSRDITSNESLLPPTDGAEMGFVGMGLILVPSVAFAYNRSNMKKEAKMREVEETGEKYAPEELKRLGDRAPDFRYTL